MRFINQLTSLGGPTFIGQLEIGVDSTDRNGDLRMVYCGFTTAICILKSQPFVYLNWLVVYLPL